MTNPHLITGVIRVMLDNRVTVSEVQEMVGIASSLLVAAFVGGFAGMMVRNMAREALGPEQKKKIRPALDLVLPQTQRKDADILDRLIKEKRQGINWEKWPHGSISDARKAVYKDILNGFSTVAEAKEYVEGLPEDNVIFTARGDEIPFSLIKLVITDIERNPWLSPFKPEREPDITWQPPLIPKTGQSPPPGYHALKLFDEKEPFFVYLRPTESVSAATKFRLPQLEQRPGYKHTIFVVIEEKGKIVSIEGYHIHEDPEKDYHVYWLPHYRPPDEIISRIERETGFKFPAEIWKKKPRFLYSPQIYPEKFVTISSRGDTTF